MKKVYFVRHGEAAGNSGGFSQTHTTPLTEVGHEQAKLVAKRFESIHVDSIYASTMDRAQDTAKHIASIKNISVTTIENFHEVMKPTSIRGVKHNSSAYQEYEKEFALNYSDPEWRYEDGENFSDILTRIEAGIASLENLDEEHVVVVSHGRLLRFITSYLLHNKELDAKTEYTTAGSMVAVNTGITVFAYDGRWKLNTWNDISHFAE